MFHCSYWSRLLTLLMLFISRQRLFSPGDLAVFNKSARQTLMDSINYYIVSDIATSVEEIKCQENMIRLECAILLLLGPKHLEEVATRIRPFPSGSYPSLPFFEAVLLQVFRLHFLSQPVAPCASSFVARTFSIQWHHSALHKVQKSNMSQ